MKTHFRKYNFAYYCLLILAVGITSALATEDITKPVLNSFSISPTSIDSSNGDRSVTITIGASDGLTGVETLFLGINTPGACEPKFIYANSVNRVTGTANSGTYAIPVSWPQYSCTGVWPVFCLHIKDKVGNNLVITRTSPEFAAYSSSAKITLN